MLSQSIPLYFHKAPIRIYNKIINKNDTVEDGDKLQGEW